MPCLSLRTDPKPRETLHSFVARLASLNGVRTGDFLHDFSLSMTRLNRIDPVLVQTITELAGLDSAQKSDLVSWTGEPIEGVRMAYRGERIVSRAIRNPEVRGCAFCLREDAAGIEAPDTKMAMRGDWLLRHSLVCLRHSTFLVPLWSAARPLERYDIQARLAEIRSSIVDGSIEQIKVEPTQFDTWLDHRLQKDQDASWLGQFSLHVVATMCQLVGQVIGGGSEISGESEAADLHHAYAAGYDCISEGQGAFEAFLDDRIATRSASDSMSKVFGPLTRKLGGTLLYDPGFDYFREAIRERILDTWPIAAGDKVLGEVVGQRRLHSITSLAAETSLHPRLLRRRLASHGIIDIHDDRADGQITFRAGSVDGIGSEAAALVYQTDMRRAMGATEVQFDALVEEGLIAPRVRQAGMRRVWALGDGVAFLDGLLRLAQPIEAGADSWEHVQDSARRVRVPLSAIFALIEGGKLPVGRHPSLDGYGGMFVASAEVDRLFRNPQHVGLAPSAFGVSVGVKTKGAIQSLIDQGYMSATEVEDARTGAVHARILESDAEGFHARFRTRRTTTAETGLSWRHLKRIFRDHDVDPVATPQGVIEGVFDREVVEAAIAAHLRSESGKR